jgi:hypothetical protein
LIKIIWKEGALRMERHALMISLILLVLILWPGSNFIGTYISTVSDSLYRVLFTLFSLIFY